jgi:hypothetical protein
MPQVSCFKKVEALKKIGFKFNTTPIDDPLKKKKKKKREKKKKKYKILIRI